MALAAKDCWIQMKSALHRLDVKRALLDDGVAHAHSVSNSKAIRSRSLQERLHLRLKEKNAACVTTVQ